MKTNLVFGVVLLCALVAECRPDGEGSDETSVDTELTSANPDSGVDEVVPTNGPAPTNGVAPTNGMVPTESEESTTSRLNESTEPQVQKQQNDDGSSAPGEVKGLGKDGAPSGTEAGIKDEPVTKTIA